MVEQHVKAALQKYRERTPKHSWSQAYLDAEQERIVSLIEEWLAYEAQRADFTVEAGEEKLAATVGDLKLQVRVDRIDAVERRARDHRLQDRHAELGFPGMVRGRTNRNCRCTPASARSTI